MTISTLAVSVIGTTSLDLTAANGYEINADGFGPGSKTFRRETATSPYVRGRFLIGAVPDVQTAVLNVWVGGSSATDLASKVSTLLAAFEQRSYTLQAVIDGVTYQWACETADSVIGTGGTFDAFDLGAFQQVVHLSIPRDPLPVAGPV